MDWWINVPQKRPSLTVVAAATADQSVLHGTPDILRIFSRMLVFLVQT
jgi:hypothetical protein